MLRTLALALVVAVAASAAATGVGVVAYRFRAELKEHVLSKMTAADDADAGDTPRAGCDGRGGNEGVAAGGTGTVLEDEPVCLAVVIRTGPRPDR